MNNTINKKVEEYVTALFEKMHSPDLIYHNLEHTKNVVQRTNEIATHYNLTEKELIILTVTAWFHDAGHLFTDELKHEEQSVEIMRNFMMENDDDPQLISEIEGCIMATKSPRHPQNLLQEIICDADTYHLGTKEFKDSNKKVYEEYTLRVGPVSKEEWNKKTVELLESHKYYTSYCKSLLEEKKQSNMKKLKKKLQETATEPTTGTDDLVIKKSNNLTTKGIQTMLRLTSENHLKLSDMADRKANILISVNSIIISVILGVLLRKLPDEPNLTIPSIIFLLVAVTTIVISIMATRPKLSSGIFNTQDVLDKKTNLLFFGNFHGKSFDEYNVAMREMMKDPDYLYGSLIKDIYQLGVVLGRKYKLIHLAYNIFMVGIIVSVAAFAIAAFFFNSGAPVSSGSPL
jgi:predicted metal-dependent HD superfamily phosphohydrolase